MQAGIEVTIPNRISPQSNPEIKTCESRFVGFETLDAIESGEADSCDDTDWQDFLSYHAGVSR